MQRDDRDALVSALALRPAPRRRALEHCLVFGALCLISLQCGCGRSANDESGKTVPPTAVSLARLQRGDITRSITLPGVVNAYQSATLYAKIPGYLKSIAVDKGDAVKEGDPLAEIEAPELVAELPKYQAEVEVTEADYRRISDARAKAPDLVVPLAVDQAKAKYDSAQANLKRINELLAFARITAPFSGIITRRWVDPGALIPAATSSSSTSAAVVTLMDFNRVRIHVAVPESEVPLVTTAVAATMAADELPGKKYNGVVNRYEYALDETTRTMIAEIELANPGLELRPGMYVNVKLGIETRRDVLLAPVDAVVTDKAGSSVYIVADNKARKVPVQTGFNDGTHVEIISGTSVEQLVILVGKRTLNNGQPVTVSEAK